MPGAFRGVRIRHWSPIGENTSESGRDNWSLVGPVCRYASAYLFKHDPAPAGRPARRAGLSRSVFTGRVRDIHSADRRLRPTQTLRSSGLVLARHRADSLASVADDARGANLSGGRL